MIFTAFAKALGQIGDPRFLRVMGFGIALSVALLIGAYAALLWLLESFAPGSISIPFVGPVGGLHTLIGWGSALLMLGLSVFLMVPVASAFSGLFLEDVAQAVEDKHYPGLPAPFKTPFSTTMIDTANFIGVLIVVNLLALLIYTFAGPLIPVIFWSINGYLLGREYFVLVATRRLGRKAARALRANHWIRIWVAGTLMAAPLSIPLLNLLIPVLGVATFTHLFHRLAR
jgi:CysZ protein